MRKAIFLLLAVLLLCGQSTIPAFPPGMFGSRSALNAASSGSGGGFTPSCTPSSVFLARASGVTVTADKTRYDTLICGLQTDGLCCAATGGVLDFLHVYAAPDSATAKLNLTQSAYDDVQTGTLTFTAYQGFTGNSSTGYLDTGFNITSSVGNFAQNSNTIGCYVLSSRTVTQNWVSIGELRNAETRLLPNQGAGPGGLIYENADGVGANFFTTVGNAQGLWTSARTTSAITTLYKNNLGSQTTSTHGSLALTTELLTLLEFASNTAGGAANFTGDQMAACFSGAGMTSTQANNLQARLNTYMSTLSVPINVY